MKIFEWFNGKTKWKNIKTRSWKVFTSETGDESEACEPSDTK